MELKDKIYLKRKELGLTLEEVGSVVGVGKSTVRKWETGEIDNMKLDKVELLAKALKCSPAYLMGWEDEKKVDNTILATKNPPSLPPLTAKDERNIQKRLQAVLDDLMPENDVLAYYDDEEPLTEEDKELLRISLENTMRLARQIAKQKFTPKKYRK